MAWSAPAKPVNWQDTPSTSTALDAANLNADEAYGATVGSSVVTYFEGGSSSTVPAVTKFLTPSGGDDSAAAATAIAAGGTIVLGAGTFLWNTTVPGISPSTPTRIIGAGIGKTIVKLSTGARRFLDFNKTVDYQVFGDVEISDLTVDVNAVGGRHHVVIGNYINGGQSARFSVNGLSVRRVRTINHPAADPTVTNHRLNIFLCIVVNVADTKCTIQDVVFEDLDFRNGGNIGISIGGTTTDGSGNGNLFHDRICITRVVHDTLATPTQIDTSTWASENIQVGSQDTGGTVTIRDCHGFNSGDVGIAVLNGRYGHVEDCTITDARNECFQAMNFNLAMPADQTHHFKSCHAKIINSHPSATTQFGTGFGNAGPGVGQVGHIILENCSWMSTATNCPPPGSVIYISNLLTSLTIQGEFQAVANAISHSLAANYIGGLILINPGGSSTLTVRGALRSNVSGAITRNGFTFAFYDVQIPGLSASNYTLDVDAHYVNYGLTGVAANSFFGLSIDPGSVLGTLPTYSGRYRMVIESHTSADTGPKGINLNNVYGTARVTIGGTLSFPNCDFTRFPAGSIGQEIVIDGTVTYADVSLSSVSTILVFYPGLTPATGVLPQPAGFAVAALTGPIMNLAGCRRKIFFTGNMPTAVTFQRRTNTTPVAMANASQVVYDLEPGDRLNLTFAGTTGNTYQRIAAEL